MWTGRLLDAEVQIHGFCTSVHFQRIKTAVANKIFQYILLLRLANLFPGCLFNMMIYISRESTKHMPGQGCHGCMSLMPSIQKTVDIPLICLNHQKLDYELFLDFASNIRQI